MNGYCRAGGKAPERIDRSRRRFARTGGTLLPVALTVFSRSSWGMGGFECWSGTLSGNLSNHTHDTCSGGSSPAYWEANQFLWPTFYEPTLPFTDVFGYGSGAYSEATLYEVLTTADGPNGQLTRHCIAAYLNAVSVPGYSLTPDTVVSLYHDGSDGIVVLDDGTLATRELIVSYLEATYVL